MHGTYSRNVYEFTQRTVIDILRYYCPNCGCTVSILPDFLQPHKRYSSMIISLCLYLLFCCDTSIRGVHERYKPLSRYLINSWLKQWWYSSRNILMILRDYFSTTVLPVEVSDCVKSKYITAESLSAFLACCDLILGGELESCHGFCGISGDSYHRICEHRGCIVLLQELQKAFRKLPFPLRIL